MQSFSVYEQQPLHNLPTIPTSFIGCEPAIATIRELLSQTRLLTLTGSGGSGKTRLALSVAESIAESVAAPVADSAAEDETRLDLDGVAWVDLAPLADPGLVPQTVADALHLREQPQRSYTELITDYLLDHRLLLVLDNCEHLRSACADLLGCVLQAGAVVRVLATSREPLGVEGERVWLVPMLSLPATNGSHAASPSRMQELLQSEAVRLFDERARAVAPSFSLNAHNAEAVAQICQRLDGLPLAIELAAARVNILMPTQIVERLDNSVHLLTRRAQMGTHTSQLRHQTLRAALDWSFDLLPAKEQNFFSRLAIFAGNFGVEAIEGICADEGLPAEELLDLLANLVEKSLVIAHEQATAQYEEMRYRLLVPVRHYAAERLRAAGEESHWRGRHATWYLELAKRAEPELEGAAQQHWLDRLESEHDNLRAALAWYAASPEGVEAGLQLSCAIGLFWAIRSYLSEGQRWLERFMSQVDPGTVEQLQVNAINTLARISVLQSNFQAARAHYERSIAIGSNIEYDEGVETGLIGLGVVLWELGEFQKARSTLDRAVRYARSAGHLRSLARALNNLGLVCMHQGDRDATRASLNEGLAINQQLGHKNGISTVLFNLAMLASHDGDAARARLLYGEALALSRELGNRTAIADTLNNLGAVAVAQGDLDGATAYFEEASHLYREAGVLGDTAYTNTGLGDVAFYRGDYAAHLLALYTHSARRFAAGRDGSPAAATGTAVGGKRIE